MVVNTLRPVTRSIYPPSPRWVSFASGFLHIRTLKRAEGESEDGTPGSEALIWYQAKILIIMPLCTMLYWAGHERDAT